LRNSCLFFVYILIVPLLLAGADKLQISLWHQMEPGKHPLLKEMVAEFERENPGISVNTLHKGTEELRTGFQTVAAFTKTAPELVYGPSDNLGAFEVMKLSDSTEESIIMPLEQVLSAEFLDNFMEPAKFKYEGHIYMLADRLGNHLALCCNMNLFREVGLDRPPETLSELIEYGSILTRDLDGDGRIDQWGLVWNYMEPFWYTPFLGGYGGTVFNDNNEPVLDSEAAIDAFRLIADLRNKYKIIPEECDYNIADNRFKQGRAAMLINGDWSWNEYIKSENVDFRLATLPVIEKTGEYCKPMISATGYSISARAKGEKLEATIKLLKYLTSESSQRRFAVEHKSFPSLKTLQDDPFFTEDAVLQVSARQIEVGMPMPVIPEMRAAWDAMRPALQNVVAGVMTPEAGAAYQQKLAKEKIFSMYEDEGLIETSGEKVMRFLLYLLGILLGIYLCYVFLFRFLKELMKNPNSVITRNNRFAVAMVLPAAILMFGVVLYPFLYNIVLSFSNMSMTNIHSWRVIGIGQYIKVFSEAIFYSTLWKTVVWTVSNVFFHVVVGVFLAVLLNRKLWGKAIFRVILILPWAIPQYIVALTWRGMFMQDSGAINLILRHAGIDAINWLSDPTLAFLACIITNIWLGIPFMMMIALGGLQSIPHELYEAARIDGAGSWEQFKRITMPLLKPVMIPAITLGIVWTFNNLNVMWLISNGGEPADSTHILVTYVYRAAFNLYRYGYAAAFSMIIFIFLAIFSITFMNRSKMTEKA
jgi:arabinogalactan oligomer / maltooligosaccharide transport system permease protein